MTEPDTSLYILTGPTASGKTQAALDWAEKHGAEIISCDAFLVYRGMDIGTAKPSKEELARVPHHLVDCLSLNEHFNVQAYIERVQALLPSIFDRGNKALITGGSAFYVKSFFAPVSAMQKEDPAVRQKVAAILENKGIDGVLSELYARNPKGLGTLDIANSRRLTRALERCMLSGQTLLELAEDFSRALSPFEALNKKLRILTPLPEQLQSNIVQRVETMFQKGLLDEVKALSALGLRENPIASQAIGYKEVLQWLSEGEVSSLASLKSLIIKNTSRLAKKQYTWIRQFFSRLSVPEF